MDPNEIKLERLSKEFEYHKIQSDIDTINDIDLLKKVAKSWAKLYLKQQEVLAAIDNI
jgi:hypothetical protein